MRQKYTKYFKVNSLPSKKTLLQYRVRSVTRMKKNDGKERHNLGSKKILPSITDSSIRIGVIYLRIETGPNALLALFFFIYDGLAYACSLSFHFTYIYRLSFTIIMSSQTETNSGFKCTSSIHECDLVGESINLRSLIYSHSLFHYMEASIHQLQQIGIYIFILSSELLMVLQ